MSRPIDADALMKAMYHRAFETDEDTMWQSGCWVRYRAIEQTVKEQPTIEPKRKKGRWMWSSDEYGESWICSECMAEYSDFEGFKDEAKYCPECPFNPDREEEGDE